MRGKRCTQEEIETMRTMKAQGHKNEYIAYKLGMDVRTITSYCAEPVNYWTPEQILKAINLKTFGFTHKEIAKEIGDRTTTAVTMLFQRLREAEKRVAK